MPIKRSPATQATLDVVEALEALRERVKKKAAPEIGKEEVPTGTAFHRMEQGGKEYRKRMIYKDGAIDPEGLKEAMRIVREGRKRKA